MTFQRFFVKKLALEINKSAQRLGSQQYQRFGGLDNTTRRDYNAGTSPRVAKGARPPLGPSQIES
jgi:hypothetical protein